MTTDTTTDTTPKLYRIVYDGHESEALPLPDVLGIAERLTVDRRLYYIAHDGGPIVRLLLSPKFHEIDTEAARVFEAEARACTPVPAVDTREIMLARLFDLLGERIVVSEVLQHQRHEGEWAVRPIYAVGVMNQSGDDWTEIGRGYSWIEVLATTITKLTPSKVVQ